MTRHSSKSNKLKCKTHLCGKQLFTWLSLVVSLRAVLSFLDEIWDVIESVSEGIFYLLLHAYEIFFNHC